MLRKIAAALSIAVASFGSAGALTPPPSVAVIVEGIGFQYRPAAIQTACVGDRCIITVDNVEFSVPADLKTRGASCASIQPFGTFVPAPEFARSSDGGVTFTFQSTECSERTVQVRFPHPRPYGETVATLTGWRLCTLSSADSYLCSPYSPHWVAPRASEIRAALGE